MVLDPIAAVARVSAVPTILRVISETTGLRLSLIAHVTDTTWTCCAVEDRLAFGLEVGGHLDLATTLCREARESRAPIVISDVANDPVYCDHHTPRIYGLQSYIAVPIFLPGGEYFGNVCGLDSRPTDLSQPKTLAMFQLFAELVGLQIDAERRQQATSQALLDERATAELREQFIAVLGHDLRTPLNAIALGAEVLAARARPDELSIVTRIRRSAGRISRLVDDVVDFARGRLGGGIAVHTALIDHVMGLLRQVVDELQAVHPERAIELHVDGEAPMQGDPVRLAQLLQNLLGNALVHSPASARVVVDLAITDAELRISVSNGGPALSPELMARMFQPFQRGTSARPEGLGLGLYIASQIVRSHHGEIDVASNDTTTTITCRLPRVVRTLGAAP